MSGESVHGKQRMLWGEYPIASVLQSADSITIEGVFGPEESAKA